MYLGDFTGDETIIVPFHTFDASGNSVTISGLAVTDIEIFKGASMTQRASDAGYTLLDTDGTDIDGITGIHGFSIDLSDNTDAGFYATGEEYTVVVSSITVAGATVSFVAATFSIQNRHTPTVLDASGVRSAVGLASANLDTQLGTIDTVADGIKAVTDNLPDSGALTTINSNVDSILASVGTSMDAKINIIDGIVDAILIDTGTTLDGKIDTIDSLIDAIKAKTDSLTFTVGNQVDANMQSINDVTVTGNGQTGTEFSV